MMESTRMPVRAGVATAVATALAAVLLALVAATLAKPAEATFPGNNGKIVFASNRTAGEGVNNPEGDFEIFAMNRDGTGLTQLTENDAFDFEPEWSPNGKRIAFVGERGPFSSDILVMNPDGSEERRVTTNPDFSFADAPAFSPDGKRVAFASDRAVGEGVDNPERDTEIFTVNLDGTGLTQLTHNGEREHDNQPDFTPDGRRIAFISYRDQQSGVFTMNSDGSNERLRSRGSATVFEYPSFSPDGKRIAFTSNQNGGDDIYAMNTDGSAQRRLTKNGVPRDASPAFSPNGEKITFETNRDGNSEIYKMRTDGKGLVNLTNDPAGDFTPDWQPLQEEN